MNGMAFHSILVYKAFATKGEVPEACMDTNFDIAIENAETIKTTNIMITDFTARTAIDTYHCRRAVNFVNYSGPHRYAYVGVIGGRLLIN